MPSNHARNYAVRDYTGCPHCGGPVNISVEINTALASLASAVLPLLPSTVAKKAMDRLALDYAIIAKAAEEESDMGLTVLWGLAKEAKESERKAPKGRVRQR
jgi:hypothetical protein